MTADMSTSLARSPVWKRRPRQGAPLTDEPSLETLIGTRTQRRLSPASAGDLHLTGDGGDAVLTGTLTYLGDLARAHQLRQLRREATGWARLRHRPAAPLLRAAFQHSPAVAPELRVRRLLKFSSGSAPGR